MRIKKHFLAWKISSRYNLKFFQRFLKEMYAWLKGE